MIAMSTVRSYLAQASTRTAARTGAISTTDIALALAGSAIVALLAQVELPFWPVPFTGQTFGVLLAAVLLGRVRGTLGLLFYLIEGAAGLPVFAGGGAGAAILFGPTGGYLIGFVAAAWVVGTLCDRGWASSWGRTIAAMTLGTLTVFAFGVPWLAMFVGGWSAVAYGFLPFLVNDIVKILAVSLIARGVRGSHRS